VFTAVGIVALTIDGGLVGKVGRASNNEHSRRLPAGDIAGINVNIDGPSLAHLACPPVNVVLVAFKRYAVNDPGYGTWMSTLSVGRQHNQGRKKIAKPRHASHRHLLRFPRKSLTSLPRSSQ
jgi:hypothetical protein